VVDKLKGKKGSKVRLEIEPEKVIYLSCNPTTQARDAAILSKKYYNH